MIQFHQATPTRHAIRDHYDVQRDPIISTILRHAAEVEKQGWDVFDYFEEGPAFLHGEEGVEDLVGRWIADQTYGHGDIQIDPDSLRPQLASLRASAGAVPDLDAITDLFLWAWWRVQYLYALIANQERGIPLGDLPVPEGTPYDKIASPAMPLHILHGEPDEACPADLSSELAAIVEAVEQSLQDPTWVPGDAKRLAHRLSAHYCRWVDWLESAGVQVTFDTRSLATALELLRQPAQVVPGYIGPQYRYGVSFPAAAFLVAQTLALDAQAPEYQDHCPDDRT